MICWSTIWQQPAWCHGAKCISRSVWYYLQGSCVCPALYSDTYWLTHTYHRCINETEKAKLQVLLLYHHPSSTRSISVWWILWFNVSAIVCIIYYSHSYSLAVMHIAYIFSNWLYIAANKTGTGQRVVDCHSMPIRYDCARSTTDCSTLHRSPCIGECKTTCRYTW